MKRFFCIVCNRIKHVRVLPDDVRPNEFVKLRTGTCRWHHATITRALTNSRGRVHHSYVKKAKSSAATVKVAAKKGKAHGRQTT